MLRHILRIAIGLALAILAAVAAGSYFGLPLVASQYAFEPPIWPVARAVVPFLPLLLTLSLAAIAAAEARGWRHWLFWALTGGAIAALGFFALRSAGASPAMFGGNAPLKFAGMGGIGGLVYWLVAGRASGELKVEAAQLFGDGVRREQDETRRFAWSAGFIFLIGLLPLAVLGWHGFYRTEPGLAQQITKRSEEDAARLLTAAGLPDVNLKVDGYVGHLVGSVADVAAKKTAYEQSRRVLAPMIGVPGVVAVLQNDLIAREDADPQVAAENARIKAAMQAVQLAEAAEAKRKADEAARRKAEIEARVAAEAKRKAEEEARRKAEEEARLAAEAKRRAEEEARRKAEEEFASCGRSQAQGRGRSPPESRRRGSHCGGSRGEAQVGRGCEGQSRRRCQ